MFSFSFFNNRNGDAHTITLFKKVILNSVLCKTNFKQNGNIIFNTSLTYRKYKLLKTF